MTFVQIDDQIFPTDTPEEIEAATTALREAGLAQSPVIVSPTDENSPESYPNGQILFA